jgi:CBS domain-containing protein
MKVKDILKTKGPEVITIGEVKNIYDAIDTLVKHRIGALIVLNESADIVGIISERDVMRENHKQYGSLAEVKDVMTRKVIIGEPEDDVEYVESIMTQNRIRHLPIISNEKLVGMISIGDIIKAILKEAKVENRYLHDYIKGKYK